VALTSITFLLVYGGGLLGAIIGRPIWGLYTYVAVFYLDPGSRWWGASLPDVRWSLVAALVTLLATLRLKPPPTYVPWIRHFPIKVLVAYVTWMVIQLLWANPMHWPVLVLFVKYLILLFLILRLLQTEADIWGFVVAHALGCAYYGYLAYRAAAGGRLEGVGGPGIDDANTLGMQLATGLVVTAAILIARRGPLRWIALLAIPFVANGIVQTGSRGAFVALAASGIVFLALTPKPKRNISYALAAIAVVVFLFRAPDTFWQRIYTLAKFENNPQQLDTSARSRTVIIKAQLRMFSDYPFGVGSRGTDWLSRSYLDPKWLTARPGLDRALYGTRASHNTFMAALVDQGFPGAILYLLMVGWVIVSLRRLKRMDHNGLPVTNGMLRAAIGSALAVVFVAGLGTNYIRAEVQYWLIALLIASIPIARAACKRPAPVGFQEESSASTRGPHPSASQGLGDRAAP